MSNLEQLIIEMQREIESIRREMRAGLAQINARLDASLDGDDDSPESTNLWIAEIKASTKRLEQSIKRHDSWLGNENPGTEPIRPLGP